MKKVLTCIMSLLPLLTYGMTIVMMIPLCFMAEYIDMSSNDMMGKLILAALFVHLAWMIAIMYFVMIRDIVTVCKNNEVKTETMAIWCVLLYFLNMWAFPVFWFMFDRKNNRQK